MSTEKIQLEEDEKILIQVRKHWFILFTQIFGFVLAGIFPLVVYWLLIVSGVLSAHSFFTISIPALVSFYACWLLVIWMAIFNVWTNYYLDVWTVTSKRLISVDQRGLFHRSTWSFRLERLQDMNVEINGILATFLDYGSLEAETAGGDKDEFKARGLPHPRELKSLILKAADDLMAGYNATPLRHDGT